jgi:hypothetical protein
VKCYDQNTPICFESELVKNIRNNFLSVQMEKAFNNSDFMGQDFIDDCPVLSDNQDEVMVFNTGSSKCSFSKFQQSWLDYSNCTATAIETRDQLYDIIGYVTDKRFATFLGIIK